MAHTWHDRQLDIPVLITLLYLRGGPGYRGGNLCPTSRAKKLIQLAERHQPTWGEMITILERHFLWEEVAVIQYEGRIEWATEMVHASNVVAIGESSYPARWTEKLGASGPPALWFRALELRYRCLDLESEPPIDGMASNTSLDPKRATAGQGGAEPAWSIIAESVGLDAADLQRAVAVVGSRDISEEESEYARELGAQIARLGRPLVSGGAPGVDSWAALGALAAGGDVIEILPVGFQHEWGVMALLGRRASECERGWPRESDREHHLATDFGCTGENIELNGPRLSARHWGRLHQLSLSAPRAGFTTVAAMERNALIYATGVATIVVATRDGAGGTWHGAREAHRRRLGPLIVRADDLGFEIEDRQRKLSPSADSGATESGSDFKTDNFLEPTGDMDSRSAHFADANLECPGVQARRRLIRFAQATPLASIDDLERALQEAVEDWNRRGQGLFYTVANSSLESAGAQNDFEYGEIPNAGGRDTHAQRINRRSHRRLTG